MASVTLTVLKTVKLSFFRRSKLSAKVSVSRSFNNSLSSSKRWRKGKSSCPCHLGTDDMMSEQICEVETQTIVLSRFHDGVQVKNSKKDLARKSNRAVGYDANIASHLIHLVNSNGSLNSGSLGFQGTDVGNATIVPTGSNWDNVTFPASVQAAEQAAQAALNATKA
jgi:hypothetical protein